MLALQPEQQPGAYNLPGSFADAAPSLRHRALHACSTLACPAPPHTAPPCRHTQEGYPSSMYGMSKLAEAAYTRVLARELEPRHIMVNAVCPGMCAPCPSPPLPRCLAVQLSRHHLQAS
jgi:NAD(P)-dependent dehydrogenase (short-subunit alcohol dehydrogenase family)